MTGEAMPRQKSAERRAAFVTGASQGLGAAIALALARDGYDVAVSAQRPGRLDATTGNIGSAGARAVPVLLDVRSRPSLERAMAEAIAALGRLDLLVNNAGVTLRKPALEVTHAEWEEVMGVNLTGTFFMSQQMGRHLVATRRPGCIISIASTHGMLGYAERSTYGISKAGIIHMTRMLAHEWAQHGIRVNAIAPGTVETASRAEYFKSNAGARQAMIERIPLRRFGAPEDVAGAVCYLAGPHGEYITGQTLVLDGGLTAY